MISKKVFITKSAEETQKLAEELIKGLNPKREDFDLNKGFNPDKVRVIALYGELGAGKTTFVQGLAKGLGIKRRIISPTFVIIRQYKVSPARCNTFYHIDLYRIESEREVKELGLDEILNNPRNIIAIEWAEKMGNLLPENRIDIKFEYRNEGKRKIIINSK